MTSNRITMIFAVLLAALLLGSVGVFFLKVAMVGMVGFVTTLLALMLMFALGLHAGGRRIKILRRRQPAATPLAG
jgi:hypothetical protein